MVRLAHLLEHQRRFVRDTSHQLRTPLAVLKAQVQSARRGDQPPMEALRDIEHTVDRATRMANQMLALAKVEQLAHQAQADLNRLDELVREVALDLAPLMADRQIEFST
jgi:two-component system, OmpR family, sensor histidine kinase TctE